MSGYPYNPQGYPPPPSGYGGGQWYGAPAQPPPAQHAPSGSSAGGLGSFLSRHGAEAAGAALMYKMGGGIGKAMAAGKAMDLAGKYKEESKRSTALPQPTPYVGYAAQSSSYYGPPVQQQPPPYASSTQRAPSAVGSDLLATGKQMLSKAEKYAGGLLVLGGEKMKQLESGCTVQLVSQVTGRALQIVKAFDGRLALDATGAVGPQTLNAHFVVIRDGDRTVLLHNNFNYLAIVDGFLTLHLAGAGGQPTAQCQLRVHKADAQAVALESTALPGAFVAVQPNGDPQPAFNTNKRNRDAHFLVRPLTRY